LSLKKRQGTVASRERTDEKELMEKAFTQLEHRRPPPPTARTAPRHGERRQTEAGKKGVSLLNIGGMKGEELSQALGLYRALVYEKIEGNWVLPERRVAEESRLEATLVVRARRDGTLVDIQFQQKSGDSRFDDSVLKAVLKSKPFPPFPDIYSPKEEEIVIHFSPANGRS
jgi:TonB family protein